MIDLLALRLKRCCSGSNISGAVRSAAMPSNSDVLSAVNFAKRRLHPTAVVSSDLQNSNGVECSMLIAFRALTIRASYMRKAMRAR